MVESVNIDANNFTPMGHKTKCIVSEEGFLFAGDGCRVRDPRKMKLFTPAEAEETIEKLRADDGRSRLKVAYSSMDYAEVLRLTAF